MRTSTTVKWAQAILTVCALMVGLLFFLAGTNHNGTMLAAENHSENGTSALAAVSDTQDVYLPMISLEFPWVSPFGVESNVSLSSGSMLLDKTRQLDARWARLNQRISWRDLQPEENGPIQWDELAGFEAELRALSDAGIKPIVIVDEYPRWATKNDVRDDGEPTSCGPLRTDKFDDFAQFVQALVSRYGDAPFNVRDWELGNEPDVDPNLVPPDTVFGCWGEIDDYYYGGEHYGEMIKVVGQAVRTADPNARVWLGGLLLDSPGRDNDLGNPELFLEGILRSGAAPYFDIVPYHAYPSYTGQKQDSELKFNYWTDLGGYVIGKARFLQDVLAEYGVSKPLFVNEMAFGCPNDNFSDYEYCDPPEAEFYSVQATELVRMTVRSLSVGNMGSIWYTINGPGWRHAGLLDGSDTPKPAYDAYDFLTSQLALTQFVAPVDYGAGIEAYAFKKQYRDSYKVHVVWAQDNETLPITVSKSQFIAAYDRFGTSLTPTASGDQYQLQVGFEPVYVLLR